MKKLILSLAISAFALASLQAADVAPAKVSTDKDAACCDGGKSSCCASKSACAKGMPSKAALMSPKAAAAAGIDNLGSSACMKVAKETTAKS